MKKCIKKAVSALLILSFILGASSCREIEEEYDESLRVEIIPDSVVYTDEYLAAAEEQFVSIACVLLEHYSGTSLSVYQKSRVRAQFKLNVIPMLYRIKIYESELEEIFSEVEGYIQNEEIPPIYTLIYDCALETLGSHRCSQLFYGASLLIINAKIEKARESFDKHGLVWYEEEAMRCEGIKAGLTEMGEARFAETMGIFTSLATLGTSIRVSDETGVLHLNEASILYVMRYRTNEFMKSNISEDEWSLLGSLFTELIPARSLSFKSSMLYEVKKASYLPEAMKAMPKVIALYASMANEISKIPVVNFKMTADEQAALLAKLLTECEDELYTLSLALSEHAASNVESQRTLISKHFGKEIFDSYSAISYEEFFSGLQEIEKKGDSAALYELTVSYLYGIAPYLTLAYLTDLG